MTDKQQPGPSALADEMQLLRVGYAASRLEIESLKSERDRFRAAYHEWSDKTEWARKSTTVNELGKHLADVLRERIEGLQAALKAAQPVVTSQPSVAYEALPDPWHEKLAELAGQLEKCGVAWMIRTNGGTTYNVGRADGARVATSELRKMLNDELVNMLTAAPTHQPAPQPSPAAQWDALDAERYRWLAASCRSTSEHWGGRWSIIIDGPAPKSHDSEDDFDAAIDAARAAQEGK